MTNRLRPNDNYEAMGHHRPRNIVLYFVFFAIFVSLISTTLSFTPVASEDLPAPEVRLLDDLILLEEEEREKKVSDPLQQVLTPPQSLESPGSATVIAPSATQPSDPATGFDALLRASLATRRAQDDVRAASNTQQTQDYVGASSNTPYIQEYARKTSVTQQTQGHVRASSDVHVATSSNTLDPLKVQNPPKAMTSLGIVREGLLGYIESRGSQVGRNYSAISFPSLEAALLSLAFLTFAVFLIDLIQDLLNGSSAVGRRRRRRRRRDPDGDVDEGVTDMIVLTLSSLDTLSFGSEHPDCGRKLLCHLNRSGWHDGLLGTASNYFVSLLLAVFSPSSGFRKNLDAAASGRQGQECVARYPSCPSILGDLLPTKQ